MKGALSTSRGSEWPIFIIGCERSGTTLLRAMLNAHPNIAIPYEAHQFSKIFSTPQPWDGAWSSDQVAGPVMEFLRQPKPAQWGLTKEVVLEELGTSATFRVSDILRGIYRAYARQHGKARWGDKTPSNTFELPFLIREFPDAQFIHIVRDGRDVYLSWLKVDWAHYDVTSAAKRWKPWVQAADRPGKSLGPEQYFRLRYEDLVPDPRGQLQRVCRFLNEPFDERMLRYHEERGLVPESRKQFHELLATPPDPSRVHGWKRHMSTRDVKLFERIAGTTLMKYGYDVRLATRLKIWANGLVGGTRC